MLQGPDAERGTRLLPSHTNLATNFRFWQPEDEPSPLKPTPRSKLEHKDIVGCFRTFCSQASPGLLSLILDKGYFFVVLDHLA
jgi:hypothetical protein